MDELERRVLGLLNKAGFVCLECGKKYSSPRDECSKCGGSDIDIDDGSPVNKYWGGKKKSKDINCQKCGQSFRAYGDQKICSRCADAEEFI